MNTGYLGLGYIRATLQAFLVHGSYGKTVWMWLMENVSNGEESQKLAEMCDTAWGATIQRTTQMLSQMKWDT